MRADLQDKIDYSVNLLRRAEKLALAYDPAGGFHLAFSGGKDSQALYHVAKLAGVKFHAVMNFTSVDPPELIRFIRQNYPDVETVAPRASIYNVAREKGLLPTRLKRWCCRVYKEGAGAGKVTLIGIRHAESTQRSRRNEVELNNRKFSGTLDQLETYREQEAARRRRRKEKNRPEPISIVNAKGEHVAGCIMGKESLLISPIIHWSTADVWDFLNEVVHVPHCSLYDEGWHRIGCIGCPMSNKKQKLRELERWPHVHAKWVQVIMDINTGAIAGLKSKLRAATPPPISAS